MDLIPPLTQWFHRSLSLSVGSGLVAGLFFLAFVYHKLVPGADPREPPLIPYTIPFLGSALPFSQDFLGFMKFVRRVMPPEIPYRLYVGGRTLYLMNSPRLYAKYVRITKSMSFDLLERDIFIKIFTMKKDDLEKFCVGMHGVPIPEGMTKEEAEEVAMAPKFQRQYSENWFSQTEGLELASQTFARNWVNDLEGIMGNNDEVEISTEKLIFHHLFWSATAVHFGTHLKDIEPKLPEFFWTFEQGFLKMFQEIPHWLLSSTVKARDQMVEAFEKWTLLATERAPNVPDNVLWEEYWGGRVLRQRDTLTKSRGLSLHGRAMHNLALLWALNANSIPVITWMIIHILRNPYLIPLLRSEASTAISLTPTLTIDFPTLTKLPLFTSIYQESLRLAVANMTARIVTTDCDFEGYLLKAGTLTIAPSHGLQLSPLFDQDPAHPAEEFWAERFMVDEKKKKELLNSWRPFAGGITYCPGRYLTAGEIYSGVALLVMMFDMELDERDGKIVNMPGRSGTGAIRPDRAGYIKLKRRKVD